VRRQVMICVVNAGLNRGLFVVALCGVALCAFNREFVALAVFLAALAGVALRAREYADKFEREVLVVFADSLSAKTSLPTAGPD